MFHLWGNSGPLWASMLELGGASYLNYFPVTCPRSHQTRKRAWRRSGHGQDGTERTVYRPRCASARQENRAAVRRSFLLAERSGAADIEAAKRRNKVQLVTVSGPLYRYTTIMEQVRLWPQQLVVVIRTVPQFVCQTTTYSQSTAVKMSAILNLKQWGTCFQVIGLI